MLERVRIPVLLAFSLSLPMGIAVQQIALAILLLLFACCCWQEGRLPRSPLDLSIVLFVAALVVSSLFSPAVIHSLRSIRRLWLIGAFLATYKLIRKPEEVEKVVRVMVVSATVIAVYGIVQHFTGVDLARQLVGKESNLDPVWFGATMGFRTKGLHPSGITYAHNLLFPLSFGVAFLSAPKTSRSSLVTRLIAVAIMLTALAYSLTRGVWLAAALIFAVTALVRRGSRLLWLVAALSVPLVILVANSGAVRQRAASIFDLAGNLPRRQIWQANLDMISERPIVGWGYGNYKKFREPYYQRYPEVDTTAHAHNNVLQIWVEGGILALLAFTYLFWIVIQSGWEAYRLLPYSREPLRSIALGCVLALGGFLLAGLTQYNFGDAEVAIMFWFTAALAVRTREFAERKSDFQA